MPFKDKLMRKIGKKKRRNREKKFFKCKMNKE